MLPGWRRYACRGRSCNYLWERPDGYDVEDHCPHCGALAGSESAVVGVAEAKQRQRESGGDVRRKTVGANLPQPLGQAAVAAEVEPMFAKEAKKRQGARTDIVANLPQCSSPDRKARDQAAEAVGTSPRSVQSSLARSAGGARCSGGLVKVLT